MKKFDITIDYEPVALLTYETAHAVGFCFETDDLWYNMDELVRRDYGDFGSPMDNKITLCYSNGEQMLFITYWDNRVFVGPKAIVHNDFVDPRNNYRCKTPKGLIMSKEEGVANLLRHWIEYEAQMNNSQIL